MSIYDIKQFFFIMKQLCDQFIKKKKENQFFIDVEKTREEKNNKSKEYIEAKKVLDKLKDNKKQSSSPDLKSQTDKVDRLKIEKEVLEERYRLLGEKENE